MKTASVQVRVWPPGDNILRPENARYQTMILAYIEEGRKPYLNFLDGPTDKKFPFTTSMVSGLIRHGWVPFGGNRQIGRCDISPTEMQKTLHELGLLT